VAFDGTTIFDSEKSLRGSRIRPQSLCSGDLKLPMLALAYQKAIWKHNRLGVTQEPITIKRPLGCQCRTKQGCARRRATQSYSVLRFRFVDRALLCCIRCGATSFFRFRESWRRILLQNMHEYELKYMPCYGYSDIQVRIPK